MGGLNPPITVYKYRIVSLKEYVLHVSAIVVGTCLVADAIVIIGGKTYIIKYPNDDWWLRRIDPGERFE